MIIRQALKTLSKELSGSEAGIILGAVLGLSGTELFFKSGEELSKQQEERINGILALRKSGKPLQYILSEAPFMDITIRVEPGVLIPRPETEILAETAIDILNKQGREARLLDLCCGSGCIALAAAKHTNADITAADISDDALRIAAANCEGSGVRLVKSDLFDALEGEAFSVIATNPPYIPSAVIATLQPEVRDCEPWLALDGGPDGLQIIRRILKAAGDHLTAGGCILMEIGDDQGREAAELAAQNGFENIRIIKDYNNMDRILFASAKNA